MYNKAKQGIIVFLFLCLFPVLLSAQVHEKNLSVNNWQFKKRGETKWLNATVPGTVHTDLLNNKLIPDPFYGTNEKELQWIENEDWEYQTTFNIAAKNLNASHIAIQFNGLDTYANVYVNDSLVLISDNMFRQWNVDVKKYIHTGNNVLRIVFESAVKKGKAEALKLPYTLPGNEKIFSRKAQYQYGWDWGPRFVTCGIWKDVKLLIWNQARILNVHAIQRSLSDSLAALEFVFAMESDADSEGFYISTGLSDDATTQQTKKINLKKGIHPYSLYYTIKKPKRWWCIGLGDPFQYHFIFDLSSESVLLDKKSISIGLRKIELIQEKDADGISFLFKLNDIPVFIKGANYIPQDNFLPRIKKKDYQYIVKAAADAHMNMLRVWGGGVYGDELFYEACDEQGILIWQDFMFACAMYPGDAHFTQNVEKEVIDQIERLRNHPALVLWCGNNEIDEGWKNWGWQKQYHYSPTDSSKIATDYAVLFNDLIKRLVKKHDPSHDYWPSSPQIGWGHTESLQQGDAHYWGVWWGMESFENYTRKVGRFMSEYGFQGMPDSQTMYNMGAYRKQPQQNTLNEQVADEPVLDSSVIKAHQKHPTGYQTIRAYMERDYIIPSKAEDYRYVSQLLQAKGMKTAIEAHRRAKPYCMGTMYWQLNDCWPVTSWSTIDHQHNLKASYYQVKRAYEDVIISIEEKNDSCSIYIISDLLHNVNSKLLMEIIDLKGKLLWSYTQPVTIDAMSSKIYYHLPKAVQIKYDQKNILLKTSLTADYTCEAVHFFTKPKNLELKIPQYKIKVTSSNDVQSLTISADVVVKDVFISVKGHNINLSDNYFDLLPGVEKLVLLPGDKHIKDLEKKIVVHSLRDTY